MTIRRPSDRVEDIRDSLNDVITFISSQPKLEIRKIAITAVASTTVTAELVSKTMTKLEGAIQIASTFDEQGYVNQKNTKSVDVSWDFGASTTGKQTVTFLLLGT